MAEEAVHSESDQIYFSNELLGSSKLFQSRSRSHKIPVRGQKEFLPNHSGQQMASLQKILDEHWTIVTEERVDRVGNLVNAEWIPEEKIVMLQSHAGKFWQTMGFSHHGKQCLYPEEALYLMECGNVQVFYQDLPLSIQEGYETFLSPETVTCLQYQVFGHLKRLGYVVNRYDYRLNKQLKKSSRSETLKCDKHAKRLEIRKGANTFSHHCMCSHMKGKQRLCNKKITASSEACARHNEEATTSVQDTDLNYPSQIYSHVFQEKILRSDPKSDCAPGRNWWTNIPGKPQPDMFQPSVQHWDFSCISFPDLGPYSEANTACLPPPDPSLLPGALQVTECHMASWRLKINLQQENLSKQTLQAQSQNGHLCKMNIDQMVHQCKNWDEYLKLVKERKSHQNNLLPYLWKEEILPLAHNRKYSSNCELQEHISIIEPSNSLRENLRFPGSKHWRITFNVYQPDPEFKKSNPGKPCTRLYVCSFDGMVPDLCVLEQLAFQSGDVPLTFAVVDHGDISFYSFKEFKLPNDVY